MKRAPCISSPAGFVLASLVILAFPAFAIDLLVYNNSDANISGSLRHAIQENAALGGGNTILFSNTVTGTITLTGGELVITTNVNIVGPGPEILAVSGNNASRVFRITNATATISGLSIVNGRANASSGGGILNNGTLLLSDCIVSNCFAQLSGGGIDSFGSTKIATIVRSSIINNQSPGYAAGLDGWVRLTNCTVAGNVGVVAVGGGTVIWSSTIAGNPGKGMYGGGSPLPVVGNSILAGNTVDALGGFISAGYNLIGKGDQATGFTALGDQMGSTNGPLNPNLRSLGFHGGPTPTMPPLPGSLAVDQGKSFGLTTDQRGRVRTYDDPGVFDATLGDGTDIGAVEVRLVSSPLVVTTTNDAGPGSLRQEIFRASTFEYDYITFATNVTDTIRLTSGELVVNKSLSIEGPGIHWFGGPGPRKLTVSGNNTSRVFNLSGGNISLIGLTIANGAAGEGGGIRVDGGFNYISGCHIVSNTASVSGGGLSVTSGGRLSVENSSVTHNQAVFSGGGIACGSSDFFDIISCTIASNRTTYVPDGFIFPRGGGVALAVGQFVSVSASTIAGNVSTYAGGGIDNTSFSPARAFIENSIIADNSAPSFGPDVAGSFVSSDYNLIGNTNNSTGFGSGDLLNVNPLLGPLADYGGPTPTMALRAGSPAIDKGDSAGYATDQRGFPRIVDDATIPNASGGDGSDIGAFEMDPSFRIAELRRVGSDVALSLTTVLGRNYRAEYTNNLASGSWTTFTTNVPGNGYLLWVTNYGGANEPRRFYRGAIVP